MPGSFFTAGHTPAYISDKLNLSGWTVPEEIGAFRTAYNGSVTRGTRLAVMPGKQMSHQLINFFVLAPRQLSVFGKRKVFRPSYFPRLLKGGNNLFLKLFEQRTSRPCGHSAQILHRHTRLAMVRPYRF
jgi:hypothetical protein